MTDELSLKLAKDFLSIKDKRGVAEFLDISYSTLTYFLYHLSSEDKYHQFTIKKKTGGTRLITSPNSTLNNLQRKLCDVLNLIYEPKACTHGFLNNRSIITNAKNHVNKKILINIDLADFFPCINFGRVRGVFLNYPFNFTDEVATVIAQLCCFNNCLPQGAPTSPIISNFVCRNLDNSFLNLAIKSRTTYSRYADDITFSTNKSTLPLEIGSINNSRLVLSNTLLGIIDANGFKLNPNKIRYAYKSNRQEVTGLIVNKSVNIQRKYINIVRTLIRLWEKYGVHKAYEIYASKSHLKWKVRNCHKYFVKHVVGKVEFIGNVKGKDNPIYIKLRQRVKALAPEVTLSIIKEKLATTHEALVLTEGKTDWKHMAIALKRFHSNGQFKNLNLKFQDYLDEDKMSNSELYKICGNLSKFSPNRIKVIGIFDRDDKSFLNKVTSTQDVYKNWGNNVFTLVLPVPDHRDFENICIEHMYTDEELKTYDRNNRRLFINKEFFKDGKHFSGLYYTESKKVSDRFHSIIDSQVFDIRTESVALSKNAFSNYVYTQELGFDSFCIDGFRSLFENIITVLDVPNVDTFAPVTLDSIKLQEILPSLSSSGEAYNLLV